MVGARLDESVDVRVNVILHSLGILIPKERSRYRVVKRRVRALIHVVRASMFDLKKRPRRRRK